MEPVDPPHLLKRPPRASAYKRPYAHAARRLQVQSEDRASEPVVRRRSSQASGADEEIEAVPEYHVERVGRFNSWKGFFSSERVLFGTWEGVYTTVLLNIVGIILFLRMGWLCGNTGIYMGIVLITVALLAALITSLSTIGICMRCEIRSGGVYYINSHVLGIRWGGTVGVIYCIGQSIVSAMYCIGFAEAFASVWTSTPTLWTVRIIALISSVGLFIIVLVGVRWVVKVQLLLLFALVLSVLDFILGAAVLGSWEHFNDNWSPDYLPGEDFFTVFGVFFPAATGIMAGTNMSGDLLNPERAIPLGTLSAIGSSTSVYMLFHIILGFIGSRRVLQTDFEFERDKSLTRVIFTIGLYIGALSSALSTYAGAPRVLQIIAGQNVIPWLAPLSVGTGANNEPVRATVVIVVMSWLFILIGELNSIAPLVTMAFLVAYAVTNYAYFALATSGQTLESMNARERRRNEIRTGLNDGLISNIEEEEFSEPPEVKSDGQMGANTDIPLDDEGRNGGDQSEPGSDSKLSHGNEVVEDSKFFKYLFKICNRWIAFFGVFWCSAMMFLIDWKFAIATVGVLDITYTYISYIHVDDGVKAAHFEFSEWFKSVMNNILPEKWQLKASRKRHIPMPEPNLPSNPNRNSMNSSSPTSRPNARVTSSRPV